MILVLPEPTFRGRPPPSPAMGTRLFRSCGATGAPDLNQAMHWGMG